jgi:NitT/TauT family transport system ATP-binding protein
MPKIILNNINFSYDTIKVLQDFSIEFQDKKINVIIGPSASGKTTLLKVISGIVTPQSGSIINKPKKISYVFQEERLIEELTVTQNLHLVLQNTKHSQQKIKELINHFLELTGLLDVKDMYPHQLSGSMRYRLSLARAFIYPSETLIMDEPFSGLDIKLKRDMINKFIEL